MTGGAHRVTLCGDVTAKVLKRDARMREAFCFGANIRRLTFTTLIRSKSCRRQHCRTEDQRGKHAARRAAKR
jgi:hypothetical protein